jgi:hypothetical protein
VLQTPVWGYGNIYLEPHLGERDTSSFYRFIQDNISEKWGLKGKKIGVRIICGLWDPSAKQEIIEQWITHLPQIEDNVKLFEEHGHFIEEHEPKVIAKEIINVARLI